MKKSEECRPSNACHSISFVTTMVLSTGIGGTRSGHYPMRLKQISYKQVKLKIAAAEFVHQLRHIRIRKHPYLNNAHPESRPQGLVMIARPHSSVAIREHNLACVRCVTHACGEHATSHKSNERTRGSSFYIILSWDSSRDAICRLRSV